MRAMDIMRKLVEHRVDHLVHRQELVLVARIS
jgi:hypothetical protein